MTGSTGHANAGCVDVVCVEHRTPELAARALAGLRDWPVRSRRVVRVAAAEAAPAPAGVEQLHLLENLGYAAACNRGAARGDGEWLLFLNADCFPSGGDLEVMLALARARPDLAALGPGIRDLDGRVSRGGGVALERLGRVFDRPRSRPGMRDVDWVAGTCMLVRRRAFEDVGGFDERFFLYCEDADLCLRLRRRGWRVCAAGDVRVTHVGGASFASDAERARQYRRGRETYMRKHAGPLHRWAWRAWNRLRTVRGAA